MVGKRVQIFTKDNKVEDLINSMINIVENIVLYN